MATVEYRGMNLVIPENDSEWREHFKLARANHRLMLRACKACGLMRYPPSHGCPWCMSLEWEWKPVSGRGHIYSYEVVHHAIQPGFKEWTPYAVVLVELDEQRGAPTPRRGPARHRQPGDPGASPRAGGERGDRQAGPRGLPGPGAGLRAASVHADRRAARGPRLALPRLAQASRPSHTAPCTSRCTASASRNAAVAPERHHAHRQHEAEEREAPHRGQERAQEARPRRAPPAGRG